MVSNWTRDDLPYYDEIPSVYAAMQAPQPGNPRPCSEAQVASDTLDAVVEYLNAHHPKPYDRGGVPGPTWAERERDMWRDRYRALQSEYARQSRAWGQKRAGYEERLARAVAAEARTTPAVPLHQPDGTRMDASHLPIGSDDDPAVFVVRESDVAAVEVEQCGTQMVAGDVSAAGPEQARRFAQDHLQRAAAHEAIARAIEAEAAVDPVEEKARELATIAYPEPGFDGAFDVADADAKGAYRRIAAHVLGQEARDE